MLLQLILLLSLNVYANSYTTALYDSAPGLIETKSFEYFMTTLKTSSATTLEDFLIDWKKADPDVFRFYLLSFRSRSLQSSTPQAPRAIVFSPLADFIASFNSHSALRGSQNIEVIRFDYAQDRFEFREVTFSKNNRPNLSTATPPKCLACHQSFTRTTVDPRPNWEPYFMWPGFFGMVDRRLLKSEKDLSDNERKRLNPALDKIIFNEIQHEEEWYRYFWSHIAPNDLRYRILEPFDKEMAKKDRHQFGDHADRDIKTTMFTQNVAQLNFRRVARLITEDTETFDFLKEVINGMLFCGNRFIPPEFLQWLHQNSSLSADKDLRILNLGDKIKLIFEPFYYDTDDWSMDFKTNGRFAFESRFGTPKRAAFEFSEALAQKSPAYAALGITSCKDNLEKQYDKYKNLQIAIQLQNKRSAFKQRIEKIKNSPLINRCISCHATGNDISVPHIPFDNHFALIDELKKPGYKRGSLFDEIIYRVGVHADSDEQMPPQALPTAQQREEFIEYLSDLMQRPKEMLPF